MEVTYLEVEVIEFDEFFTVEVEELEVEVIVL
jgi:hypothetical protein